MRSGISRRFLFGLDLAARQTELGGVRAREAHVRGTSGFNHDSIVRRENIITCKMVGSFLRMV